MITNEYAAEYGTSTTGIVKVETRAGTSQLGGEAFAFCSRAVFRPRAGRHSMSPMNASSGERFWAARWSRTRLFSLPTTRA